MRTEETKTGISRRSVIKKGAIAGGAVVWATPIVQTIGQGVAGAQTREGSAACGPASADTTNMTISSQGQASGPQQVFSVLNVDGRCGECDPDGEDIAWSVVGTPVNMTANGPLPGDISYQATINNCANAASITLRVDYTVTCRGPESTCRTSYRTETFEFQPGCVSTGDGVVVNDADNQPCA